MFLPFFSFFSPSSLDFFIHFHFSLFFFPVVSEPFWWWSIACIRIFAYAHYICVFPSRPMCVTVFFSIYTTFFRRQCLSLSFIDLILFFMHQVSSNIAGDQLRFLPKWSFFWRVFFDSIFFPFFTVFTPFRLEFIPLSFIFIGSAFLLQIFSTTFNAPCPSTLSSALRSPRTGLLHRHRPSSWRCSPHQIPFFSAGLSIALSSTNASSCTRRAFRRAACPPLFTRSELHLIF